MSNIAYKGVSTGEQNEVRQIAVLKHFNIDKWFIEKISGKRIQVIPNLKKCWTILKRVSIYIKDFSHLSYSSRTEYILLIS